MNLVVAMLTMLVTSACTPGDSGGLEEKAALGWRCSGRAVPIHPRSSPASLELRCALLDSAIRYVAEGGGVRDGIAPRDTAAFTSALIQKFETAPGSIVRMSRWHVQFSFAGRDYGYAVALDRVTGKALSGGLVEPLSIP